LGVILKIETQKGFKNLPRILLKAMRNYPLGVMIARGDLAIETGWKNFASIQEEIMRVCEAAHIPDVWATQVLETLAKKGVPTRAEITDSAMAQRAECVMLNKGYYINKAVKMLDKILRRMQVFQNKKKQYCQNLKEQRI
jgi:pyruvate kinase